MNINFQWLTAPILNLLRYHKLKILVMIMSAIIFFVLLFPFSDVSLFVSNFIAKSTKNQVVLQFEDLALKLLPFPGFQMSQIVINTPLVSGLKVNEMIITPAASSIFGNIGMTAQLNGVMGGNLQFFIKILEQTDQGEVKLNTYVRTQSLSIQEVLQLLSPHFNMDGLLNFQAEGQLDSSFEVQPDFKLQTQAQNFKLQALSVPTPIGPFPVPAISLRGIVMRANLKEGQLQIENLELGQEGDDIVGQINGFVDLQIRKRMNKTQVLPGNYNLVCRLVLKSSLENHFKALLNVLNLSQHKKGNTYAFRITGNPNQVPNVRGL